jgi:hypothetical protein
MMDDQWLDALEYDDSGLYEAEDFGDLDDGDAESARSRAQARARARRLAILRQRTAMRQHSPRPAPRSAAQRLGQQLQRNQSAIQTSDLENKVRTDTLAHTLSADRRRIGGAEQAIALDKVIDQLRLYFPQIDKEDLGRLLAPLVPLITLRPEKRGQGLSSFISDPRAWGPLAGAALLVYSKMRGDQVANVNLSGPVRLAVNQNYPLRATLTDRFNKVLSAKKLNWTSADSGVATVDDAGVVHAVAAGTVAITGEDPDTHVKGAVWLTIT